MTRIVFSMILLGALPLLGEQNPDALIRNGWEEYRFLSLDLAEKQFSKALKLELTPEQQAEALVGLAMTLQYAERGRSLDRAEEIYQQVLELQPGEEIKALILSNLADLHLAREEDEEAAPLLSTLMETEIDSVIGQDALRRWIHLQSGPFGSEQSRQVADQASEILSTVTATPERPRLLPILHNQVGGLYFWLEEYERAAFHFELFTTLGSADTTSYGSQASALFRLAQIYEDKLQDRSRAGHFYRRLVLEYPNSNMVYFSLEKAVQFGAMNREEVLAQKLSGMTPEILDELFDAPTGGGS